MRPFSLDPAVSTVREMIHRKQIEIGFNRFDFRGLEDDWSPCILPLVNRLDNIQPFQTLRADIVKLANNRTAIFDIFNQSGIGSRIEHPIARGGSKLTQIAFVRKKLMAAMTPLEGSVDKDSHKTRASSEDSQNGEM